MGSYSLWTNINGFSSYIGCANPLRFREGNRSIDTLLEMIGVPDFRGRVLLGMGNYNSIDPTFSGSYPSAVAK